MAENEVFVDILSQWGKSSVEASESMKALMMSIETGAAKMALKSGGIVNTSGLNVTTGNLNTYTTGGVTGSSGTWSPLPPIEAIRRVDAQTWQIGDEQITEFVLIALVAEWRRKQQMIANRPKFTSVEQAEKWLDAVS